MLKSQQQQGGMSQPQISSSMGGNTNGSNFPTSDNQQKNKKNLNGDSTAMNSSSFASSKPSPQINSQLNPQMMAN
jgi:hypothetical protein